MTYVAHRALIGLGNRPILAQNAVDSGKRSVFAELCQNEVRTELIKFLD